MHKHVNLVDLVKSFRSGSSVLFIFLCKIGFDTAKNERLRVFLGESKHFFNSLFSGLQGSAGSPSGPFRR